MTLALLHPPGYDNGVCQSSFIAATEQPISPDSRAMQRALDFLKNTSASHLLWLRSSEVHIDARGLTRMLQCALDTKAALTYSDYLDHDLQPHPLTDYQPGSIREGFDFGPAVLISRAHSEGLEQALSTELSYAGWYDLRLQLSERGSILRIPEPVYHLSSSPAIGEAHFAYVDPANRAAQLEYEQVATAHLRRIGAYLEPPRRPLEPDDQNYDCAASVVIPVKNRARTIKEALQSALSQRASFHFNVIVVDNHSTDGTSEAVAMIAASDPRCIHLRPTRRDLGIGGCWNEAIFSPHCGRYAVQLDSDDLYASTDVLEHILACFAEQPEVAMVIGSYTIVNFSLKPIPPGLIDHREWSDSNGHNNALRINGLGAPRAFHVPTLRRIAFPNVSYGEDYAVALRLTREYRIGRSYQSLYWCRRWEENSDASLDLPTANRYDSYKDRLRSIELAARQKSAHVV